LRGWGVLTVEVGPRARPIGGGVGDALDEVPGEGYFRFDEGDPVLLLEEEEPGHLVGPRGVDQPAGLGLLLGEVAEPDA
jgi:hypothetical protein